MEFLLITFLFIVLFGYLLRFLVPFLLKWYVKRMQKRYGFTDSGRQQRQGREGEVRIDPSATKAAGKKKKVAKNVGDYVDFEEVR